MAKYTVNQHTNFSLNLGFSSIALLLVLLCGCIAPNRAVYAQRNNILHMEPPHWWVGMDNNVLEILIHADNIASNSFDLSENRGVSLQKVKTFSNRNYVNLVLQLDDNCPAHTFQIKSRGAAGRFNIPYELKARRVHQRSFDQGDFIYLITPDRFANGDPGNDDVAGMEQRGVDRSEPYARHGGDLQGIIDHLDFIQGLGVTAIWPNPLYENNQPHESYHGYAFTSHYKIDPRFGDNGLFAALCDSLHARGMKMVMDVVYNHVGNRHHIYADMPDSSWFHLHKQYTRTNYRATTLMDPYASKYDRNTMSNGWFDKHMPDINQRNPEVARYLIQQTLWWIEEYSIDALRIDTYAYPDQKFMVDWAKEVKANFPELFIFAEIWDHGRAVQAYFMGNALGPEPNYIDGLTDFQVHFGINDALTKAPGWTEGINRLYYTLSADYVYEHPENLVTFLDNHDVARFFGVVNRDKRKFDLGVVMLMTMRGIPSLYYGTELLMAETDGHGKIREDVTGGWPGDPVNKFSREGRSVQENEAYDLIAALAALRKEYKALQHGNTTQFVPIDGVYAYFRHNVDHTFLVVVNVTEAHKTLAIDMFRELAPAGSTLNRIMGEVEIVNEELQVPGYSYGIFEVIK